MAETKRRQLRVLPGLVAEDFQHPSDVKATAALRSVPGFDKALSKVMEYGLERVYYLENVASNVRVTDKMFPRMHRALRWGCKILDVDEPEMYVTVDPVPKAFTYGNTRPFIVFTSGLIDMLDDEERFFVIGHELGRIKADHVLYTLVAENIAAIVEIIGQATLGIGALLGQGLVFALYEWQRKAELTCDRAGLLCVQDFEPCVRAFMKLAGGARSLFGEMDRDEFMRQIRTYEEADTSNLNKAYKVLLTLQRTHPFSIERAAELETWHASGEFERLLNRGRESQ